MAIQTKRSKILQQTFTYAVLTVFVVIALFPIWQVVNVSLRPGNQLLAHAFRVGIGIGPPPVFGAFQASLAQALADRPRVGCPALAGRLDELFVPFQLFGDRELA